MTRDDVLSEASLSDNSLDIAIVGMAGRFPGAVNIDAFWQNIRDGVETITFFTDEELIAAGVAPALVADPTYVKARPILKDIELFDAAFFGFSPREAEILDPQHRIFLECAWEALENAGYTSESYDGAIGVFAGATISTYLLFNLLANPHGPDSVDAWQIGIGNEKDSVPTRVSYLLNLRGPSIDVQSACSTSLVAVHLACQSLLSYQSDMALAGGISIRVPQKAGYVGQAGLWSTDGHCRAFDAKASGMITGDGAGVVVLKRLADAIADHDCIRAVIKGSAVNNDGALKIGYTAPGLSGQEAVIVAAQAIAGVAAESIRYVETHGTGTPLGDSIEIGALTQAFRASTAKKQFCAVGSLKSNMGHLDNAAGVAGLIKTVLALEHKVIPPSLNFEEPNPDIDFENSPFYVNTRLTPWPSDGLPRRAGVSAFGIGGTNAHVILEEAAPAAPSGPTRPWQLLALSARSSAALAAATDQLAAYLEQHPQVNLADVAFTYQRGRRAFDHRRILVCRDPADARAALEAKDAARLLSGQVAGSGVSPALVFMFPGLGDQYVDMAYGLYQAEPTFRQQVDRCAQLLQPYLGLDLRALLYAGRRDQTAGWPAIDLRALLGRRPAAPDDQASMLQRTDLAQPVVFVVEYALAQLLMEWGVRPQALIGHSLGEYVAACLAGVFSLEDALMIIARRAQIISQSLPGSMLAVSLAPEDVRPFLCDGLALAIVNGPSHCVLAGETRAIEELERQLVAQGVPCRPIPTGHAFHSHLMEPLAEQFTQLMAGVNLRPPQIPYISNVTGTWITHEQALSPAYWSEHMCRTVRFSDGLALLLQQSDQVMLEVGPGQSLSSFVKRHPQYQPAAGQLVLATLPYAHENQPDQAFLLTTLGQLWLSGVPVDWAGFYAHERRQRLPLPTYPFERQRYWIEPAQPIAGDQLQPVSLERKPDLADWFYLPIWKQTRPIQFLQHRAAADEGACCLVFEGRSALGARLAEGLRQAHEVIAVREGSGFIRIDHDEYTLQPGQADDYEALFETLRALGKTPQRIVHLWSLAPDQDSAPASSERSQEVSFYSLLYLVQALGKHYPADSVQLTILSDPIYRVTGEECICPEKATLVGACQVIPLEYPNMRCQVVDLAAPRPGTLQEKLLVDQVLAEITATAPDASVAYRDGRRWIQTFEAVRLEREAGPVPLLRDGGTYLLIGGLGGIGLVLARYLATAVPAAKLALLGRSGLPAAEAWDAWLDAHGEQDPISKMIGEVRQLAALGAEVLVVKADVTNEADMRAAIQQVRQQLGHIHGVIHCAGVERGGLIALKTAEMAAEVLDPKVKGLRTLEAIFEDSPLDFLILCSSISALRGRVGQVDHCASFTFMDAFAHYYTTTSGTPSITIQWPAWREVGLAVNIAAPALEAARQDILKSGISSQEGAEAFERALRSGFGQVAVSPRDLQAVLAETGTDLPHDRGTPLGEHAAPPDGRHPRPVLRSIYVAPGDDIERAIAEIWQNLLGIDGLGSGDNFIELGGHSLLAVQAIARLNERFKIEIPLGAFFEAPTIAGVAAQIKAAQGVKAEEHPAAEDRDIGAI